MGGTTQAFPVCAIPIKSSHPYLGSSISTGGLSRMCNGKIDGLYSNRTATGMMSIPNAYPREAMRSAMNFAAQSKHVCWNMYPLQGKVYPLRNPQVGAPQRSSCAYHMRRSTGSHARRMILVAVANGGESRA